MVADSINRDYEQTLAELKELQQRQKELQAQIEQLSQNLQHHESVDFDWQTYSREEEEARLRALSANDKSEHIFTQTEEDERFAELGREDEFDTHIEVSATEEEDYLDKEDQDLTADSRGNENEFEDDSEEDSGEMPLWQHLEDLRWVILKSLGTVLFFMIIGLFGSRFLQKVLRYPVERANQPQYEVLWNKEWVGGTAYSGRIVEDVSVILTNPEQVIQINNEGASSAFMTTLQVGLIFGIALSLPFIFYFVWTFVSPALKAREQQWVLRLLGAALGLFLVGTLFGYGVICFGVPILAEFAQEGTSNIWRYMDYVTFCSMMMVAFGIVFELPILLIGLIYGGILSVETLIKYRAYIIVVIFIAAAILTPPDPVSQLAMAMPLCCLFQISIWIGKMIESRRTEKIGD